MTEIRVGRNSSDTLTFKVTPAQGKAWVGFFGCDGRGLLVGLSRPEGNIAVVVGIVCLLVLGNRRRRTSLLSTSLVLYVIPGLIYLVWRYSYYGHLFPLPYYLKLGDQPTGTLMELATALNKHQPGDKVQLVYQRGGKQFTVEVTLAARGD